jgi:hypothetical protein
MTVNQSQPFAVRPRQRIQGPRLAASVVDDRLQAQLFFELP